MYLIALVGGPESLPPQSKPGELTIPIISDFSYDVFRKFGV